MVTVSTEDALRAADAADRAVANGARTGPLHGVPFTVKDCIDTAGVRTQRGSSLFADHVPVVDATAVARFRAAGGILLGKTNLPEFSGGVETDNLVSGRTNNPWDLARTPGGSSGGDAAALAAGMSPISIGSDVAISLRGPAAFSGITALKATHGRIPFTGHFPTVTSEWWHIGPMARSVRDVSLGYSILSGPDGRDGFAVHRPTATSAGARLAGRAVRVGWVPDAVFAPVDPEITAAVRDAADRLADLGCDIDEVDVRFLADIDGRAALMTLIYSELISYTRSVVGSRIGELSPMVAPIAAMDPADYSDTRGARADLVRLRGAFAQYFQDYDVLLCPVNPVTARPHGIDELDVAGTKAPADHLLVATSPFNVTGLPALSVPYGFSSEQLPIGIQLVGNWFDEATILDLGALLERRGGLGDHRPQL